MTSAPQSVFEGSVRLQENNKEIESVQASIEEILNQFNYGDTAMFAIRLSIEEAMMNGFRHGNLQDPTKFVEIRWRIDSQSANFHVIDEGEGFDPEAVPDPTLDENLEIPSGRGLMLIRAYMTDARYHNPGNHLEMNFRKGKSL
ncbi:MAG: ATP-binding protein [Planctomycetota bacterium]|nr:ATP-binding protein [Planctomycetota bacterium]MDA1262880.1 ATP-binding protein [Planctomycetota bacterium]